MEECMLETNVDPKIILGKVKIKMFGLSISPQGPLPQEVFRIKELVEEFSKVFPQMLEMILQSPKKQEK